MKTIKEIKQEFEKLLKKDNLTTDEYIARHTLSWVLGIAQMTPTEYISWFSKLRGE